ncbi:MAG: ATP-binding cassette domain-containing protein [Candidatus Neomarinimicrobiota bacterium]|nr:MAG: ATP-binding cassette domain-containing protein [Candidatus Neomarinimicrobiota bacterium]
MSAPALFDLEHVGYDPVLRDLSLRIFPGEHWVIMGPSGAGKSTCLRLFNGLLSPTGGRLTFHGSPLETMDPPVLRQKVGMLFQEAVMLQGTVEENLCLPLRWRPDSARYTRRRIIDYLHLVELDASLLGVPARTLSGGEKQRVALARILLNDPEVLLLDEPTASLDPPLARKILRLVHRLQREFKLTVIRVSHHPELARDFADHVCFIQAGRILEAGPISRLDQPVAPDLREFLEQSRS